jgi:hypothetical protein
MGGNATYRHSAVNGPLSLNSRPAQILWRDFLLQGRSFIALWAVPSIA